MCNLFSWACCGEVACGIPVPVVHHWWPALLSGHCFFCYDWKVGCALFTYTVRSICGIPLFLSFHWGQHGNTPVATAKCCSLPIPLHHCPRLPHRVTCNLLRPVDENTVHHLFHLKQSGGSSWAGYDSQDDNAMLPSISRELTLWNVPVRARPTTCDSRWSWRSLVRQPIVTLYWYSSVATRPKTKVRQSVSQHSPIGLVQVTRTVEP